MRLTSPHLDALSSQESLELERCASSFEDAWQRGDRPCLDDYLGSDGPARWAQLVELVHTDLEYRLKAGEPARVEDYLGRYPELARDRDALLGLIATEWELRRRAPGPCREEYRRRFPDLGDELSAALADPDATSTLEAAASAGLNGDSGLHKGRRLGKFVLLEVVGSGSFGTVHRAYDPELRRTVALKVPHPGRVTDTRFLREAQSAAPLRHPGIVAVHDAGQADGTWFLVSEFVLGQTLAQRLAGGRVPFRKAAELIAAVADALHHAHQNGVIHRDVKPSNILLERRAGDVSPPVPRLTDFGLARRDAADGTLTEDGQPLGTPAYMPPEQAAGEAKHVDARSDVYSLGVVLYELLTGELPFRGNSRMVLRQVLEEEPRPPRQVNDEVPRDLETVCLKAMAKEPGRRYGTAAEFAADLRCFLAGRPVQARPVGTAGRLALWCRRRPLTAGLTAALALALAGGFAGVLWEWRQAEAQRRQAEDYAADAEKHAAEAERQQARAEENFRQAHELVNEFMELGQHHRLQGRSLSPIKRELMLTCLKYYQRFLTQHADDPTLRAELARCQVRSAYLTYQLHPHDRAAMVQARQDMQRGVSLSQRLIEEDPANVGYRTERIFACCAVGDMLLEDEKPAEALRYFLEARDLALQEGSQGALSPSSRGRLANACWAIGVAHRRLNHPAEAYAALERAIDLWEDLTRQGQATASTQANLVFAYYQLGEERLKAGQMPQAEAAYRKVLSVPEASLPSVADNPHAWYSRARSHYALAKMEADRPEEAVPHFEKAAAIYRQLIPEGALRGPSQLGLGACCQCLGDLHRKRGRLPWAIACYQEGLPIREQRWRAWPYLGRRKDLVQACYSLGQALEEAGRREEALTAYLRAIDRPAVAPRDGNESERQQLSKLCKELANLLRDRGKAAEADLLLAEEKALWKKGVVKE